MVSHITKNEMEMQPLALMRSLSSPTSWLMPASIGFLSNQQIPGSSLNCVTCFALCLTSNFSCQSLLKCHIFRGPPWPGCEEHFYLVQEQPWPFVHLFVKAAALCLSVSFISFLLFFFFQMCIPNPTSITVPGRIDISRAAVVWMRCLYNLGVADVVDTGGGAFKGD